MRATVPGQVTAPAVASSFVGRTAELATIARLRRERLVTLVGPGGGGKTRLAVEAVRAGPGVLHGFVELAGVTAAMPLAATVLAGCGIREEPGRDPLDRLREQLRRTPGLLVLDNCEQLRAGVAALVADLLRHCPALRVLLTSRVTLGVAGEVVVPVGGLDPGTDAVALFLDRATAAQPDLLSVPGAREAARSICALTDGLPLAIELAAAHARALSPDDIRTGMSDRLRFLTARDPSTPDRHRSLEASIGWSLDLVPEAARAALEALSVVAGPFSLDAALAVAGGPDGRAVVETLVDHSLVRFSAAEGWYALLDTIREHAARRSDGAAARTRLVEWAAGFAREVSTGLARADPAALALVDRDAAAVRSALDHAVSTGERLDLAARIVVDLAFGWALRGRCVEGRRHAEQVAAAIPGAPDELAWAVAFLTVYSGAMESGFGLAAELAAVATEPGTRARALILVGMMQMFTDASGAEAVLAGAAALATGAGDDWGRVEALQTLAYTHLLRSDHAAALSCVADSWPALERLGHGQLQAWDAAIRADAAAQAGHFDRAESLARSGLAMARAIGEPVSAGGALLPLLRTLLQIGRPAEAAALVVEMERFFDVAPGLGTADTARLAAALVATWCDPEQARAGLEQAYPEAVLAGLPSLTGELAVLLAVGRLAAGDRSGACSAADAASEQAAAVGSREIAVAAMLARCAADRAAPGAPDRAHRALTEAADAGLLPLVPDALDVLAGIAVDGGSPGVAARLHAASAGIRTRLGACVSPLARGFRDADVAAVAGGLPTAELAAARAEGARLDAGEAVAYASRTRGRRRRPRSGWESLTPTEHEVVGLAAQGLSNPDIGVRLLIGTGTVRTHLRSVFAKLGVTSRAELAAHAARRGL